MEDEMVMITKKPGIKNCIRISDVKDIPDFLKDVVSVQGEELVLDCLEGKEKCPLGSVIAFEKLDNGKIFNIKSFIPTYCIQSKFIAIIKQKMR